MNSWLNSFIGGRVWPHGEIGRAGTAELSLHLSHRDPRVDRQHATLIRQQRIDVQLADFGNIRSHLRQFDQNHRDGVQLHRGHIPVAPQQPRDARACDQITSQWQVERWQRQRLVVNNLNRRAAPAEHDDGAEGRIVGKTKNQFARLGPHHHCLHDDARDPRLRAKRLRARQDVRGRRANGIGGGEIEHDAADVGFVNDVARHDLEHHGGALREQH
jgi:hypothetical protein